MILFSVAKKVGKSVKFTSKKLELILFCITVFICTGCAHFASNSRACEEAPPLTPLPHVFLGNIFQISPCTSIEPLRIETGVELNLIRGGVIRGISEKESNFYVEKFAERMGCKTEARLAFLNLLIENKDKIFGPNFENSNRKIVKSVREMTLVDAELKKGCW